MIWRAHPKLNVLPDRHFTAPSQIATLNTILYRHLPQGSVLALNHVNSQRNTLVQLADFLAGSVYEFHKGQNTSYLLIEKTKIAFKTWQDIKGDWFARGK